MATALLVTATISSFLGLDRKIVGDVYISIFLQLLQTSVKLDI